MAIPNVTGAQRPAKAAPWWRGFRAQPPPRLNLALQGGGAHGAFTWGVLDALLEHPGLDFEGLSGSSAGAMNAVLMAQGWMNGGRNGAREALRVFWTAVGKQMSSAMVTQSRHDEMDLSLTSKLLATLTGYFPPWQLNPLDLNPLRDLLEEQVDFERLRSHSPFKLFVGATNANTGKLRLFREHELTPDMLLASACLPKIQRAIDIDGQPYWDGGFSANPAVFPLFFDCEARDILLVLLSPLVHEGTPKSVGEIDARILELMFSAHFMREMRMFTRVKAFSAPGWLVSGRLEQRLHRTRFHMVDSSAVASLRRSATRMLAYGPFLEQLRMQGRERGQAWLDSCAQRIGRQSTVNLESLFG